MQTTLLPPGTCEVEVLARIKDRVEIDEKGCWNYVGWDDGKGYRKISIRGRGYYVHRVVFVLLVDDLRANHDVDHRCSNRSCCNPLHLQKLTRLQHGRTTAKRVKKRRYGKRKSSS